MILSIKCCLPCDPSGEDERMKQKKKNDILATENEIYFILNYSTANELFSQ